MKQIVHVQMWAIRIIQLAMNHFLPAGLSILFPIAAVTKPVNRPPVYTLNKILFILAVDYSDSFILWLRAFFMGFRRHQVAKTDPEIFIHGPKIAGARATIPMSISPTMNPSFLRLASPNVRTFAGANCIIAIPKRMQTAAIEANTLLLWKALCLLHRIHSQLHRFSGIYVSQTWISN